jgi:hypothetical protein
MLSLLMPAVSQVQNPPVVQLTVLPAATLPGLGASFLLTVTNPADQPQTLAGAATLGVTTAVSNFDAEGLKPGDTRLLLAMDQLDSCDRMPCLRVPARGQREIYVPWSVNEFFSDRRLSFPGTYQLRLTMYLYSGPGGPLTSVSSNSQTLTVQPPSGADASVWQLLQQITGGKGWGGVADLGINQRVPHEIEASYSSSTYAGWFAGWDLLLGGSSYQAALAEYDRALLSNLPQVIRDEKLLGKGELLAAWSQHAAYADRNADLAVSLADQARPILARVRDTALTGYVRNRASETLSKLLTRELALSVVRSLAEHDPPAPARVQPYVECVSKGAAHSFSARFGYTNPNRTIKVLDIGGVNLVSPAPVDQGQPRVFKPGDHRDAFTATSAGGNIKWHLDGSVAEATEDFAVRCP